MPDSIIREFHEASTAYRLRFNEELARLENIRDLDVRKAKAEGAVPADIRDRLLEATIRFDEDRRGMEQRVVESYEALGFLRQAGSAQ